MTDTIRIKSDHDILTEQRKDLKYLCGMLQENKEYQKEQFNKINDKLEKQHTICANTINTCNDRFTASKIFWKVVAILFTLIVGSYGYTATVMHLLQR